ncbi:MAG: KpsF/GutQ family sugar-phosphate isomerase [Pararhizobium sp.]
MTRTLPTREQVVDQLAHDILDRGRNVVAMEAEGLTQLRDSLGDGFVSAAKALLNCSGRVIVSGLGKSGHVGTKIAATLASTGTPASFVHAGEAAHGDMGMISRQDVVILLSNSGETPELMPIIQHVGRLRIPLIGISSSATSTLSRNASMPIVLPDASEACPVGIAPTTSTTMMLALGDALAMVVMQQRGFSRDDFRLLHPGGSIGLRLMKVSEFMHRGDRLPLVRPDTPMSEVIMTMTSKSFGIAGVVGEHGGLVGVITDGDLRRHITEVATASAHQVMTSRPRVIKASMLAEDALKFLNAQKVTALFVVDDTGDETGLQIPLGIVNVHDFLRLGLN